MLSIQDVGKQILSHTPLPFYVMVGTEYGIKEKYIQILREHYGSSVESSSVSDLISMMRTRHIIPLTPKLYIVRYDEMFVSSLSDSIQTTIESTNIVGTIVCIYEQSKHSTKLAKYLPNFTVSVDSVSPQFVQKYLKSDFPSLSDDLIKIAVSCADNYGQAKNMCRCMATLPADSFSNMSPAEIAKLFGHVDISTENQLKQGIAAKDFKYLVVCAEKYPDEADHILYAILSTMVELDKLLDSSYAESNLRPYVKYWSREDIYHMFMHTYAQLVKLRSSTYSDVMNSVIYLIALLKFSRIPTLEAME